jgi:hypothetical protein
MPRAGFEPSIPATKRLQTYALDHAATGICTLTTYFSLNITFILHCLLHRAVTFINKLQFFSYERNTFNQLRLLPLPKTHLSAKWESQQMRCLAEYTDPRRDKGLGRSASL